jgi:K+-sensing histidine kinase KdpD
VTLTVAGLAVLEMITKQVSRLERMLGDLMDMTRLETGRLELQGTEKDVRPLVRSVGSCFRVLLPAAHPS